MLSREKPRGMIDTVAALCYAATLVTTSIEMVRDYRGNKKTSRGRNMGLEHLLGPVFGLPFAFAFNAAVPTASACVFLSPEGISIRSRPYPGDTPKGLLKMAVFP